MKLKRMWHLLWKLCIGFPIKESDPQKSIGCNIRSHHATSPLWIFERASYSTSLTGYCLKYFNYLNIWIIKIIFIFEYLSKLSILLGRLQCLLWTIPRSQYHVGQDVLVSYICISITMKTKTTEEKSCNNSSNCNSIIRELKQEILGWNGMEWNRLAGTDDRKTAGWKQSQT